jgi:hypothetical protein
MSIVSDMLTISQAVIKFLGDSGSGVSGYFLSETDNLLGFLIDDDKLAVKGVKRHLRLLG